MDIDVERGDTSSCSGDIERQSLLQHRINPNYSTVTEISQLSGSDATEVPGFSTDAALSIDTLAAAEATSIPHERRRASWLALLVLPARVAVGALSFAAGARLSSRSLRTPLCWVSGLATTAVGQWLVSAAVSQARVRADLERAKAECALLDRMHWLDAIQAVGKIVNLFSQGLQHPSSMSSVRSLFLDVSLARLTHVAKLARRLQIARTRPRTRMDVLDAGRHYLDFALASYGFLLLRLMGVVHPSYDVMVEGSRGEDVARYMLHLTDTDLPISCLDGEGINLPRHFVALDHARLAIVVSIRGTNSISDIITDLICANEPFAGGYAHAGMKAAAETLCSSLLPTLRLLCMRHPRYSIVLTGHSLGAGVAILLTKLLLLHSFGDVKCYAFAPCPVFGPMHRVDTDWSDALECFVHADDLVATLCLSSARRLALEIDRIEKIPLSIPQKRDVVNQRRADIIEDMLNHSRISEPDPREQEVDQLYLPCLRGVHWVIPEGDNDEGDTIPLVEESSNGSEQFRTDDRRRRRARAEKRSKWKKRVESLRGKVPPAYVPFQKCESFIVRPRFFEKLLVTPNCINSHFPNVYAATFSGLDLPPRDLPLPPKPSPNFTRPWYANEFG